METMGSKSFILKERRPESRGTTDKEMAKEKVFEII
jgi:hypothetical protein